jgi:YegS/Rv2252/BmrU family lipid kinase
VSTTAFLVNPAAGAGRAGRVWPDIARRAAAVGLNGKTYTSERRGHLGELALKATRAGADLLVIAGGDGSLNEVVDTLLVEFGDAESRPVLAQVPLGTGKDFVRTFGIPKGFDEAIATASGGDTITIDAGRVEYQDWEGSAATSHFVNIGSAGISGAIAKKADSTSKALGGKASFVAATLRVFAGWKPGEMTVAVEPAGGGDAVERTSTMHDVMVANCRYLAGGMRALPEALPDDGLFDVLLLGNLTKVDLAVLLPKSYWGGHVGHPKVEILQGTSVSIDSSRPLPIELDGEQPGTTPVRFQVLPSALRLRVPRGSKLV